MKTFGKLLSLTVLALLWFVNIFAQAPNTLSEPFSQIDYPNEEIQCMWFDSLNVQFVGNWPFAGSRAVAHDRARDLVFCSSGGGVYIFEVTNPAQPTKLSEKIHTRGFVEGIFYDSLSLRLYIASGIAGLEIWGVSNPVSPLKLGFCDTPYYANNVHVSGSYAYVADQDSGLRIIDVSDSSNPTEISACNFQDKAWGVSVFGFYAYIAAWFSGLFVVDISNPYDPNIISNLPTTQALNVYVSGDYAYLADWFSVRVFDISEPLNTYEIGYLGLIYAQSIYAHDSTAFVVKRIGGNSFYVLDVSDPSNPTEIGRCDAPGSDWDVCGTDNSAFVATYDNYGRRGGLICINVSNPSNPQLVGKYYSPGHAGDVFISDSYCYVADGTAGLRILDISSPEEPFEIAYWDSCYAEAFSVSDSFAYLIFSNLYIINIATPANPFRVGFLDIPGIYYDIFVLDSFAYVVGDGSGFRIIDVSDPSNPQEISHLPSWHCYWSIYVQDSFAYITSDTAGLYIMDISNPYNPQQIGHYNPHAWAIWYDVHISGSYAYVGTSNGLIILSISNPSDPYFVGSCNTYRASGVYLSGSYAYIADHLGGLRVIDVSTPSNPTEVGYYDTPSAAVSVFAADYLVYVANANCGVQIYQNSLMGIEENKSELPTTRLKLVISPNPFATSTRIKLLGASKSQKANLTIYDASGRLIKTIPNSQFPIIRGMVEIKMGRKFSRASTSSNSPLGSTQRRRKSSKSANPHQFHSPSHINPRVSLMEKVAKAVSCILSDSLPYRRINPVRKFIF